MELYLPVLLLKAIAATVILIMLVAIGVVYQKQRAVAIGFWVACALLAWLGVFRVIELLW